MRVPGPDEVGRRLQKVTGAHQGTGATEDVVLEAEEQFGGRFPPSYRHYLREFGWGKAGEVQILGLGPGVTPESDLRQVGRQLGPDLAHGFVPVARDRSGVLLLNLSHEGTYESPVYRLGDPPEYVAHDFSSWLWMALDRAGN